MCKFVSSFPLCCAVEQKWLTTPDVGDRFLLYFIMYVNNNIKVNEREANKIFLIKTKHGKAPEQWVSSSYVHIIWHEVEELKVRWLEKFSVCDVKLLWWMFLESFQKCVNFIRCSIKKNNWNSFRKTVSQSVNSSQRYEKKFLLCKIIIDL